MGDNKVIWIPLALHEMTKEFEKQEVFVTIENYLTLAENKRQQKNRRATK
jgi:hypothetical protein